MKYKERLQVATKIIHDNDERDGQTPVDAAEFGVTAELKPHQVEGLSWLIRRYLLGVNVLLGRFLLFYTNLGFLFEFW